MRLKKQMLEITVDSVAFRQLIAVWFATQIAYATKYDFDENDNDIECQFKLADYSTLDDFLDNAYGVPTDTDDWGRNYDSFDGALGDYIDHYTYALAREVGIPDDDIMGDKATFDYIEGIIDTLCAFCRSWLCAELFAEGATLAHNAYVKEQAEAHAQQVEEKARVTAGQMLLDKYKLKFKKKINRGTPQWYAVRRKLVKIPINERKLIALALHASNRIIWALRQGEVPR